MFDAHSHIRINDDFINSKKNISEYLRMLSENSIDESIVTIDPFIDKIRCKINQEHYVKTKSSTIPHGVLCKCTSCDIVLYEGEDPYLKYNKFLIENMSELENIYIFPVLSVTPGSFQYMIDFYISEFGNKIKGIKGYTGMSAYTLDQIGKINCSLPLLVHCGTYDNQNPSNMIKFASNFNNYLILAHFAGLNLEAIKTFKNMENVFIDISPAKFIFNTYIKKCRNGGIFNKNDINSVDDMFEMLANNFDINRIVWGSDFPYSNQKEELSIFLDSNVFSSSEKEQILSRNIKKVLK